MSSRPLTPETFVRVRVDLYPVDGKPIRSEISVDPGVIFRSLIPLPRRPVFPSSPYTMQDVEEFESALKAINAAHKEREATARRISDHVKYSLMRWFASHDPELIEAKENDRCEN